MVNDDRIMTCEISIRTVAVVVGIETYLHSKNSQGICGVTYAEADARSIAQTIKTQFDIEDEDLHLWVNQEATKTRFENELKYLAGSLGPESRFIFYYAGHGFYANSANRLTVWDTHPTSLDTTTVCIKDIILSPLEKSKCSQVLLFIDACAVPLLDTTHGSREFLSNMNKDEFQEFVKSRHYQAIFMSCSPGEKSFPSKILGHGIWTYHLLRALNGLEPDALQQEEWLTDASLQNYLSHAVNKFIRDKTEFQAQQKPFALVQASNTFEILRFLEDEAGSAVAELPELKLMPEKIFLRQRESRTFNRLPGFDKKQGHTVPNRHNTAASNWASKLLSEEIASESKKVYENTKSLLDLKRKDVKRTTGEGNATVDTEYFRMTWETGQDSADASQALVTRKLWLRVSPAILPVDFDSIFPVNPDELVIPIEGKIDYDTIANGFESIETVFKGAAFEEDEDEGQVILNFPDGISLRVMTNDNEFILTMTHKGGALALLRQSAATLASLGQKNVALLLSDAKKLK